jgi:hypothetical protein
MVTTTKHVMACGFRILYGYTQSDEISLLFHRDEDLFGRKLRKLESVLAGEASAAFALALGAHAAFDGRVSQLPDAGRVRTTSAGARRMRTATRSTRTATGVAPRRTESVGQATEGPRGCPAGKTSPLPPRRQLQRPPAAEAGHRSHWATW